MVKIRRDGRQVGPLQEGQQFTKVFKKKVLGIDDIEKGDVTRRSTDWEACRIEYLQRLAAAEDGDQPKPDEDAMHAGGDQVQCRRSSRRSSS